MGFINIAGLPSKKVSLCCVGEDAAEIIRFLEDNGTEVIRVRRNPALPDGLASHADLQVFHAGKGLVFADKYQGDLIKKLREYGFEVRTVESVSHDYPGDCKLNALLYREYIIGNARCIAPELAECYPLIHVKQGYAKCSSILLNRNTVFTDDPSIYKVVSSLDETDCRMFTQNDVLLDGYDKGFIGGCCGKIDRSVMLFSGRLEFLSSGIELKKAFEEKGIIPLEIGEQVPVDFGGLIPLMQYE